MKGKFIRNAWYVAAWESELGSRPLPVKVIGEDIVLFRKGSREVVALSDTCPHRFAPLHRGKVVDDRIQCGYHGLQFDESGRCVHNPAGRGVIPKNARVTSYPTRCRDTLIWVWMGDPGKVDSGRIPDFHWLNDRAGLAMSDEHSMRQQVGYELIIDNLLDLSHGAFLHPTTLGSEALARGTATVTQSGTHIDYERRNPDGEPPQFFVVAGAAKPGDRVDYWNDMHWDAPGAFYLDAGITPAGRPRDEGAFVGSVHVLTPVSETLTVYRWRQFRSFATDNHEMTRSLDRLIDYAFQQEDGPMLAAIQERMAGRDFWEMKPLLLADDKAAVLARRTLKRVLEDEQASPSVGELCR